MVTSTLPHLIHVQVGLGLPGWNIKVTICTQVKNSTSVKLALSLCKNTTQGTSKYAPHLRILTGLVVQVASNLSWIHTKLCRIIELSNHCANYVFL